MKRFLARITPSLLVLVPLLPAQEKTAATSGADDRPVTLRVVDEKGAPLSRYGYRVSIETAAGFPKILESDVAAHPGGETTFTAPASALLTIEVAGGDAVPARLWCSQARVPHCALRSDDRARSFVYKTRRTTTWSGVVTDADTGKPVAYANVMTPDYGTTAFGLHYITHVARTDAGGRYTLEGVDPAVGVIAFDNPGYRDIESFTKANGPDLKLKRTEEKTPRAVVRGKIVDTLRRPVADVKIRVAATGEKTVSQVGGGFELPLFTDAREVKLILEKPGQTPVGDTTITVTPTPITFMMTTAPAINGTVTDENGSPVNNITIEIDDRGGALETFKPFSYNGGFFFRFCGSPDSRSPNESPFARQFSMNPDTRLRFHVSSPGFLTATVERPFRDMGLPLDVRLRRAPVFFGKIILTEPARDGTVVLIPSENRSLLRLPSDARTAFVAPDGSFAIAAPCEGRFLLSARGPGSSPAWCEADTATAGKPLTITTDRSARLKGFLKNASPESHDNTAFERGFVEWRPDAPPGYAPDTDYGVSLIPFMTDENGAFDIPDLPAGKIIVRLENNLIEGTNIYRLFELDLKPGETHVEDIVRPPPEKTK